MYQKRADIVEHNKNQLVEIFMIYQGKKYHKSVNFEVDTTEKEREINPKIIMNMV